MELQITEMSDESEFIYLNVLNSKLDRCHKDGLLDPSIDVWSAMRPKLLNFQKKYRNIMF